MWPYCDGPARGSLVLVRTTLNQDAIREGDESTLHVDRFGLSIGSVSVGLPLSCTSEDVYRRYLDLLRLLQRGPVEIVHPPLDDLRALSEATGNDDGFVRRRLEVLQRDEPSVSGK